MEYAVSGKNVATLRSDCVVLVLNKGAEAPQELPAKTRQQIREVMDDGDFSGAQQQTVMLRQPEGLAARRLLLVGTGTEDPLTMPAWGRLITTMARAVSGSGAQNAALLIDHLQVAEHDETALVRESARMLEEATYRFDSFRSKKPSEPVKLRRWRFVTSGTANRLSRAAREGRAIGTGVRLSRELGNTPANVAFPEYLAEQARSMGRDYDRLTVRVIGEKQLERMGMGGFCAVSQGSEHEGKMIVFEYKGDTGKPLSLVGKGITFDSGGISIKPGASMEEMKFDMCGAASVFGAMKTLCELNLKLHVVAVVAAAENMPDGRAYRPGDIIKTYSGQTVEIINTDAEGRMVLCDALTYVQNKYKPHTIIDMATLTGACVMALGDQASAVYSNDDDLSRDLLASGEYTGDRGWPMPLFEEYGEQLKSTCADMQHVGGPKAGSITAAKFLQQFVGDVRWAHLDIAGTAWKSGSEKGSTGRPVPLLTRYMMDVAHGER